LGNIAHASSAGKKYKDYPPRRENLLAMTKMAKGRILDAAPLFDAMLSYLIGQCA
jgi:hypothetical protein